MYAKGRQARKTLFVFRKALKTKYHQISTIILCPVYSLPDKYFLFYDMKLVLNIMESRQSID